MLVDAATYLAQYRMRRVCRPDLVTITALTYPLESSPEQSWLPIAFRGFAQLARRNSVGVRDLLIIGSGNGVDCLGATEIFDLRSVAITDLFEDSIAAISGNVQRNLAD